MINSINHARPEAKNGCRRDHHHQRAPPHRRCHCAFLPFTVSALLPLQSPPPFPCPLAVPPLSLRPPSPPLPLVLTVMPFEHPGTAAHAAPCRLERYPVQHMAPCAYPLVSATASPSATVLTATAFATTSADKLVLSARTSSMPPVGLPSVGT